MESSQFAPTINARALAQGVLDHISYKMFCTGFAANVGQIKVFDFRHGLQLIVSDEWFLLKCSSARSCRSYFLKSRVESAKVLFEVN